MQSQPYKIHLLVHSAHLLEERLRSRLTPLGVLPRQARVLDALERMGQASQAELAREVALTAASMSTMTSLLLSACLIETHVDKRERRSNVLKFFKHGQSLFKKFYREWREIDQEKCDVIGAENADPFASLTYQLRNALDGSSLGGENQDSDASISSSKSPKSV